jgi:hypothetical protein
MTVQSTKLGPGTLIFTLATTPLDASCQVSACVVAWSKNKDDDVRMLCGDVKAGSTTYTAQLSFTVDQDLADTAGFVFWSWDNHGQVATFEFVPNTDAGATVTGSVTVDPVDVGGDTGGDDMTSDATWDCVGEPTLTAGALADDQRQDELVDA